jgi:hypothetical protein
MKQEINFKEFSKLYFRFGIQIKVVAFPKTRTLSFFKNLQFLLINYALFFEKLLIKRVTL